jgi:amino acid transporter
VFIPFTYLNDMISAGVLLSFNLTNSSLICVRRAHPSSKTRCKILLTGFNVLALISSLLLVYCQVFKPSLMVPLSSLPRIDSLHSLSVAPGARCLH